MTPEEQALEQLRVRKVNYQLACNQPAVQEWLQDMAKFAGMGQPPIVKDRLGKVDVEASMIMIGRQEMFLRIQHHMNLPVQTLFAIYTGKPFRLGDE